MFQQGWEGNWHKLYHDALFNYMTAKELEPLNLHLKIKIGDELNEKSLRAYDKYAHSSLLPPSNKKCVTVLIGDGHQKVMVKCQDDPINKTQKRNSKGRRGKLDERLGHGWFMLADPDTGRVLCCVSADKHEDNNMVTKALLKILDFYPNVNFFGFDRNFKYMPSAKKNPLLKQISYYSLDCFHAHGHCDSCPCNPLIIPRLKNRVRGMNTSVCEQIFAASKSSRGSEATHAF
eukprot:TRINITY_DN72386_c0_g1_i1.p1 TRINITY_DN72386_c0_g1~~TRINITY_DN72386_c0_g1_i1.p1  ORF type:complete len:233 (+),score=32.51 TRINITY_DN72386_c0_g1_i1:480-1178(+)